MIHQGHILNVDSTLREMRCVRVGHDHTGMFPLCSKGFVSATDLDNALNGRGSLIKHDAFKLGMDLDNMPNEVAVHAIFPARRGNQIYTTAGIDVKQLKVVNGKRVYNLHYIKPVPTFDLIDMDWIRNYVHQWGAITLKMSDLTTARRFIDSTKNIVSMYKYHSVFGSNTNHTDSEFFKMSPCSLYATFIDINYCVPIWNPKKVDGMGLLITLRHNDIHAGHRYLSAFETAIVMTNYQENVFKVDGCKANDVIMLGGGAHETMKQLVDYAKKYEEYNRGKKGKAKSEGEGQLNVERYIKASKKKTNYGGYTNTATYNYVSGETSSATYYSTS